jgi:hypothetical protein
MIRFKSFMKKKLNILLVCVAFFSTVAQAEDLQAFLQRVGTGNGSQSDLHTNFHGSIFVGGQTYEMDHDKMVEFWKQQKTSGTKLKVDNFTFVSKTETPTDNKGAVISVVAKVGVTEQVAGQTMKIESTSHFIVLRDSNDAFQILYLAVPKQVRNASTDKQ